MMTYRAFELAVELVHLVSSRQWDKANEVCEELLAVLQTYKESC